MVYAYIINLVYRLCRLNKNIVEDLLDTSIIYVYNKYNSPNFVTFVSDICKSRYRYL